jgi:hypothetical protein
MTPEQIAAQLRELIKAAIVGTPARLTVEQGMLIELTIVVIEDLSKKVKELKGEK